jgi:Nitrous oxide-stimulated promoter
MMHVRRRHERERRTLAAMVEIHCADWHEPGAGPPCAACESLLAYADRRLEKCPYGDAKPTCAHCPIHCYKPAQREQVRAVMCYAGPRMLLRHPWLSLAHVLDGRRRVEHPMTRRRARRTNLS